MAANRTFDQELRFMVDNETMRALDALMVRKGIRKKNEMARRLLTDALARENAEAEIDLITNIIRRVIKEELKVSENRQAKINAKSAIASGTAMYMAYQALKDLGTRDMQAIYEAARKKAVNFVQSPLDEIQIEDKNRNTVTEQ